jgi:hypothetical protein
MREVGFVRTNEAISVTTLIMTPMRIGHKHQSYAVIGFLVKSLTIIIHREALYQNIPLPS